MMRKSLRQLYLEAGEPNGSGDYYDNVKVWAAKELTTCQQQLKEAREFYTDARRQLVQLTQENLELRRTGKRVASDELLGGMED